MKSISYLVLTFFFIVALFNDEILWALSSSAVIIISLCFDFREKKKKNKEFTLKVFFWYAIYNIAKLVIREKTIEEKINENLEKLIEINKNNQQSQVLPSEQESTDEYLTYPLEYKEKGETKKVILKEFLEIPVVIFEVEESEDPYTWTLCDSNNKYNNLICPEIPKVKVSIKKIKYRKGGNRAYMFWQMGIILEKYNLIGENPKHTNIGDILLKKINEEDLNGTENQIYSEALTFINLMVVKNTDYNSFGELLNSQKINKTEKIQLIRSFFRVS